MDVGVVVLRLIHIGCGVFWAGTLIFFAVFLEPSIREAGPGGGSVMQGIMRRGFVTAMPIIAALTILSGVDLMRRASAGFQGAWFGTPNGLTFTVGAVSAIVAFVIGVGVIRPSVTKMGRLGSAAADTADPGLKQKHMAQIEALQAKARLGGRLVAVLLALTVVTMAVARYLG